MSWDSHSGVAFKEKTFDDASTVAFSSTDAQVGVVEIEFNSEGDEVTAYPASGNPGPQIAIGNVFSRYRAIIRMTYNLVTMDNLADAAGWQIGGSGDAKTVGVGTGLKRLVGGTIQGLLSGIFFRRSGTEVYFESLVEVLPGTTNTITIDGTPNQIVFEGSCLVAAGDDGFIKFTQQALGTGYPI